MTGTVRMFTGAYVDSVVALRGMRAMRDMDGVDWATALMTTPANIEALKAEGIDDPALHEATANDFVLAVRANDTDAAERALDAGQDAAFAAHASDAGPAQTNPRALRLAMTSHPETNVAIVSVPGPYAALAAFQALGARLHVLLFSDNVPVEEEIALKHYARQQGLLVMGPGAGTAMLAGTGLGFANAVGPGRVGVVAAAGTGAQEAMTLLDRWGVGVSQVIGVGGRDLHDDVGGEMTIAALEALRDDPGTDAVLLVSKLAAREVAQRVIAAAGDLPLVAAIIGLDEASFQVPATVQFASTLESGVITMVRSLGMTTPDPTVLRGPSLQDARKRLAPGRTTVHGLFSGGTLCYESLVILARVLGPVHSNTPINPEWALPAPAGSHQCLDLGEEEYTRGRPHPMIDAAARIEILREHAQDPTVAAIILDVVLGHGSNPDPAGELAPVCAEVMAEGGPQVVAYVLGTERDPQILSVQRDRLIAAGCIVTETAARASLAAAAISTGDLSLVGSVL